MLSRLFLCLLLSLTCILAIGQGRPISGKVAGGDGKPLAAATVTLHRSATDSFKTRPRHCRPFFHQLDRRQKHLTNKPKQDNLLPKTMIMDGTVRANIKPGMLVNIILKKDQQSGVLAEGIVKNILTSAPKHHRGIKVRLEDGQIGRVQEILEMDTE